MEITRKIYLKNDKIVQDNLNPKILVVDINTSLLSTQLQIIINETKQNKKLDNPRDEFYKTKIQNRLFKVAQNEMFCILKDILISIHPETSIIINLNLSKLIIPLHNWYMILDRITLFPPTKVINSPYHIYITEQSMIERQDYIENNVNLSKWIKNLSDSINFQHDFFSTDGSNETYLDDEYFVKNLLMQLFQENNLNEREIEQLLLNCNNLGDLLNQLHC
ncbi:Spo16p PWA37_002370 [Arxiozyma heterogenica]|uniref:Spo16p n=1 Tax=Arxiozyma heterogenica TaxID=278026 RepID=UPI002EEB3C86